MLIRRTAPLAPQAIHEPAFRVSRRATRALVLLLLALLLLGCSGGLGSNKGSIRFEEIFEERREDEMRIAETVELDVDGDGEDEWLVLYRYDPTQGEEEWENTPIQGIAYDAVPCDPPLIHAWRLPFPDNDYLGEGEEITASMEDWLGSSDPHEAAEELIIEAPGPANTLSIYRFRDEIQNPCAPPDNTRQGFNLLGFFRANGRIERDETSGAITTYQRSTFERSQLAIRSVYQPRLGPTGQTFLNDDGRVKAPDEQSVDFLFAPPELPTDSPYPEKAVAAFYLALGQDHARASSFLTDALANEFDTRLWGLDVPASQISRVLIYSISYNPDRTAELARQDREVSAVVAAVDHNGVRYPPRRVTWRLVGIPIPDEEDCEWRLAELKSVIVTEGLGYAPLAPDTAGGIALER